MKVVLADDHDIFRQSLGFLLNNRTRHAVVGDVSTFEELYLAVQELNPDCILVDYHMPGGKALHTADKLRAINPQLKIIVLTGSQSGSLLKRISLSIVDGLVHKSDGADTIIAVIDGVETMSVGTNCVCSDSINGFIASVEVDFTQREFAVLELLVEGMSTLKIAEHMSISARTVEKHKQNMMNKTGIGNVIELIEFGHRLLFSD